MSDYFLAGSSNCGVSAGCMATTPRRETVCHLTLCKTVNFFFNCLQIIQTRHNALINDLYKTHIRSKMRYVNSSASCQSISCLNCKLMMADIDKTNGIEQF